jgi:hypothetical protein
MSQSLADPDGRQICPFCVPDFIARLAVAAEQNGGSGVSRNLKVTTQRDRGALHRVAWSRCLAADAKAARG